MCVANTILNCQCLALGQDELRCIERDVVVFHREDELRFPPAKECSVVGEFREISGEQHSQSHPHVEVLARIFIDCDISLRHVVAENSQPDATEIYESHTTGNREVETHVRDPALPEAQRVEPDEKDQRQGDTGSHASDDGGDGDSDETCTERLGPKSLAGLVDHRYGGIVDSETGGSVGIRHRGTALVMA